MNTICIAGNVGKPPEVKFFDSGTVKATFSVGVRPRVKDGDTEWFDCEAWGKTAETIGNYVTKGTRVGITGYVFTEKWTDKQTGQKRSRKIVRVDRLDLLSSRNDSPAQQDQEPASDEEISF